MENRKLFWKEVRKEMGGKKNEACRLRRSDGVIGSNKENEGRKGPWRGWYNSSDAEIQRGKSCRLDGVNMQPSVGAK